MLSTEIDLIWLILISLILGLIIGIERGWSQRHKAEGSRIAGIRTFALTGLLGGLTAALAREYTPWLLGFGLLALVAIMSVAFSITHRDNNTVSITGYVGLLITYVLGAVAVSGEPAIAVSAAVLTALLLDGKPELHGVLKKLREYELDAGLRLLLISIVLLPLLPDQGFGPWQAINPYEIWWMVVLIATISFMGYFAIRIGGTRRGILFTSVFAGLSSSTALTLQFSHLSKSEPRLAHLLASGILFSCGTMFPRIVLVLFVINPVLSMALMPILLSMMLGFYLPAIWLWYQHRDNESHPLQENKNPLALSSAFLFGFLLMLIMLLSHALSNWLGDTGTLMLAGISGISDVDPITLTLGNQTPEKISLNTAILGIYIAATVNSIVKLSMVMAIGESNLAKRVTPAMLLGIGLGVIMMLLQY